MAGSTWKEIRTALSPIRRAGYVIDHGDLDPGVVGIAALYLLATQVRGSITLVLSKKEYELYKMPNLAKNAAAAQDLHRALLAPRSVALVGASDESAKTAGRTLLFLRRANPDL